jgi:hypothetical protein
MFFRPKFDEPVPVVVTPMTLAETKIYDFDTSNWMSFRSEGGVIELRYPERVTKINNLDVTSNDFWGLPSTTHVISLEGKYLPLNLVERIGPENEAGVNINVWLYDGSDTIDVVLGMDKKMTDMPSETTWLTIGEFEYQMVTYEASEHSDIAIKSFIRTLRDGRILHVHERAAAGNSTSSLLNFELADRMTKTIIASMQVK